MEIQFLGTGAGMPSKLRNTSAIAMRLMQERGTFWLFDCGEATQHQILNTSLKPRKLEKIFITHMHGDHILGLPGLLSSRSFLAGDDKVTIYGPKDLKKWLEMTFQVSNTYIQYDLELVEAHNGVIFEDEQFIVEAQELSHGILSFGYRITQKPLAPKFLVDKAIKLGVPKGPLFRQLKSGNDVILEDGTVVRSNEVTGEHTAGFTVTILGDTTYCEQSIAISKNADLLVHEATFDGNSENLAREYGHSTIIDAANVAKHAGVGYLIATHISARYMPTDLKHLLIQGKQIFNELEISEDFALYSWKNKMIVKDSCKNV